MSKDINKKKNAEVSKKATVKKARTVQQSIPYEAVYPNGMIMIEKGLFSKSYYVGDTNFATEDEEKQEETLKNYGKLLNKFSHNVTLQVTIFNRKTSIEKVENQVFLSPKADNGQEFRDEYNDILSQNIKEGGNDIKKERYLTLSLRTTDVIMANNTFNTLDNEIQNATKEINKTGVKPLTVEDRLTILYDVYHNGNGLDFANIINKYRDSAGNFSLEKQY